MVQVRQCRTIIIFMNILHDVVKYDAMMIYDMILYFIFYSFIRTVIATGLK
jgi:hypothetical protein